MKVSVFEPLCHVPLCLRLNFEELSLEIGVDEKDDEQICLCARRHVHPLPRLNLEALVLKVD